MVISEIRNKVYTLVQQVPAGRVTTYGAVGKKLGISPRAVGYALHLNKSNTIPCHRVVNRNGRLAPTFAFGGFIEHKKRLAKEGVEFRDKIHVKKEFIIS